MVRQAHHERILSMSKDHHHPLPTGRQATLPRRRPPAQKSLWLGEGRGYPFHFHGSRLPAVGRGDEPVMYLFDFVDTTQVQTQNRR